MLIARSDFSPGIFIMDSGIAYGHTLDHVMAIPESEPIAHLVLYIESRTNLSLSHNRKKVETMPPKVFTSHCKREPR